MSAIKFNRIFITGPPGVGKTTAIQEVCNILKQKNVPIIGFYTKEVRNDSNARIGFNIVTLDGKTGILARTKDRNDTVNCRHTIGNYAVFVNEFESLVVPLLKQQKCDVIFVIDEIGKMELFSHAFEKAIVDLYNIQNIKIIATIPLTKMRPIPLLEKLKNSPCSAVISVSRSNRNNVPAKILNILNFN